MIDNLDQAATYRMVIFAVNAKGRSEPTIIDDINFKGVAKFTGELRLGPKNPSNWELCGNNLIAAFRRCLDRPLDAPLPISGGSDPFLRPAVRHLLHHAGSHLPEVFQSVRTPKPS